MHWIKFISTEAIYFTIYTYIQSSYCTLSKYTIFTFNFTLIKLEKKIKVKNSPNKMTKKTIIMEHGKIVMVVRSRAEEDQPVQGVEDAQGRMRWWLSQVLKDEEWPRERRGRNSGKDGQSAKGVGSCALRCLELPLFLSRKSIKEQSDILSGFTNNKC